MRTDATQTLIRHRAYAGPCNIGGVKMSDSQNDPLRIHCAACGGKTRIKAYEGTGVSAALPEAQKEIRIEVVQLKMALGK
mgnify:CR=1 FL=1